ncbi:COPII coat GTPase [Blastocladiella emersonii ATCC 22665]|nr:COPII coat GTPase [Blastocladiella emersonii ATCC 22665]
MSSSPAAVLARLPKVKDIIRIYGLTAKSQLSQNFILDQNLTDKIVSMVQPRRLKPDLGNSLVVEVGPGPGMLTRSLIRAGANKVIAIEKDSRFLPLLGQLTDATEGNFQVVHGDVLEVTGESLIEKAVKELDFNPETMPIHLVGNLPFNVATPLLFNCLHDLAYRRGLFSTPSGRTDMTLMFQREVGERITAPPRSPARSRISVMSQVVAGVDLSMIVPASVFVPRPKVDAAVVHFTPRPPLPEGLDYVVLEALLRQTFTQRRKTIRNNLANFHDAAVVTEMLERAQINPNMRAQDLTIEDHCRLAVVAAQFQVLGAEIHSKKQDRIDKRREQEIAADEDL